jgi:hypothetical protein
MDFVNALDSKQGLARAGERSIASQQRARDEHRSEVRSAVGWGGCGCGVGLKGAVLSTTADEVSTAAERGAQRDPRVESTGAFWNETTKNTQKAPTGSEAAARCGPRYTAVLTSPRSPTLSPLSAPPTDPHPPQPIPSLAVLVQSSLARCWLTTTGSPARAVTYATTSRTTIPAEKEPTSTNPSSWS